jgi:hypothetical protein
MLQRQKSIRVIFLSALLILTFTVSNQAHARISIGYYGGHYGYGHGYGHKYGHSYGHSYGHRYYNRHHYPSYSYRHHYYPSHSYPYKYQKHNYYSYRPYQYSYSPYKSYNRSYSSGHYSGNYAKSSKHSNTYNNSSDAWTTLANGHAKSALTQFGNEAQTYPNAGLPKAGFALAAAISGDLDKGVWAMRRAFQYDPDSLHQLAKDTRLQHTLNDLIAKYEYPLQHSGHHKDEAFMVSALNYLKGDYAAADQAAALAEKDGDRSKSFKNLQQLLVSNNSNYKNKKY